MTAPAVRAAGRPRVLAPAQVRYAQRARAAGVPMTRVARMLGCCRCTLYRALARAARA